MATVAELRRKAWELRRRADNLWKDAGKISFESHKKPFMDKVGGMYKQADRLELSAC